MGFYKGSPVKLVKATVAAEHPRSRVLRTLAAGTCRMAVLLATSVFSSMPARLTASLREEPAAIFA